MGRVGGMVMSEFGEGKDNHNLACWMVVRDDAYYVDMAIKSVLPYVDGFYILDNGSDDGTIEIIESFNSNKIILEKIKYNFPNTKQSEYWGYDEQYDGNSLESQTRNMCVRACTEAFKPDWLIQLDSDEVYTKLFFETLATLDLSSLFSITHSTDVFWGEQFIARQPDIWLGDRFDPHHRSWNGKLNVKWHMPKGKHVIPVMMPEGRHFGGEGWIDGIVHIHLHRMFGPKSTEVFMRVGGDDGQSHFEFYNTRLWKQLWSNAKKVDFDWEKELPFVIEKWKEWGMVTERWKEWGMVT